MDSIYKFIKKKKWYSREDFDQDINDILKYGVITAFAIGCFTCSFMFGSSVWFQNKDNERRKKIEYQIIENSLSFKEAPLEKRVMDVEKIRHGDFNNDGVLDLRVFFQSNQDPNYKKITEFYGTNFDEKLGPFLKSHGKFKYNGYKYIVTKFGLMVDNS